MNLTKIKHGELKKYDIYCVVHHYDNSSCVFIATKDGDKMPLPDTDVYLIDAPDYTHELTQFSWKLKQLDDKVGAIWKDSSHVSELERKIIDMSHTHKRLLNTIGVRDTRIEELKEENSDLKTIAANSESYTHRMDELLASTKRAYESLHQRYDERRKEIEELESELADARRNQCVCSDPTGAQQLDLLANILKIVNTTIHQKMRSPHRKNDAFDGDRMRDVCDVVTNFRKAHNIVG